MVRLVGWKGGRMKTVEGKWEFSIVWLGGWKMMGGDVFHPGPPKLILPNLKENDNENVRFKRNYYPYYLIISNSNMGILII